MLLLVEGSSAAILQNEGLVDEADMVKNIQMRNTHWASGILSNALGRRWLPTDQETLGRRSSASRRHHVNGPREHRRAK